MNICKTDIRNLVRFLDDAAEYYWNTSKKPKDRNRSRQISLLNRKLKKKFNAVL